MGVPRGVKNISFCTTHLATVKTLYTEEKVNVVDIFPSQNNYFHVYKLSWISSLANLSSDTYTLLESEQTVIFSTLQTNIHRAFKVLQNFSITLR